MTDKIDDGGPAFPMVEHEETVEVQVGGGGYAYVKNRTTGQVARYDISAWRVRFVDVIVGQSAPEQSTNT